MPVLEEMATCGLASKKAETSGGEGSTRENETPWKGNSAQDNGGLHFTGYSAPGDETGSCTCLRETFDPSATYSEKEPHLCGFACQHQALDSKEKDASKLLQGEEEDLKDDVASKAKEELPDYTRAPGGRKVARQQRHRSAAKDKWEGRFTLSGGKQRQSRKRSDSGWYHVRAELLKHLEGLASFCISCFKLFIHLIVQVTHRCGEGVEVGGKLLYSCCSFSQCDIGTLQTGVQAWIQHAKMGYRKLMRQLGSWASLMYHLLKMLCAVLFLVLMLILGSLRLCWQVSKLALFSVLGRLAHTSHGARLLSALDLPRVWAFFKQCRTYTWVVSLFHKWHELLWMPKGLRTNQPGDATFSGSPGESGQYQPGEVMARLLAMAHTPEEELNPFQVLGLEATASDAELKRAYRQLAVLVSIPFELKKAEVCLRCECLRPKRLSQREIFSQFSVALCLTVFSVYKQNTALYVALQSYLS